MNVTIPQAIITLRDKPAGLTVDPGLLRYLQNIDPQTRLAEAANEFNILRIDPRTELSKDLDP